MATKKKMLQAAAGQAGGAGGDVLNVEDVFSTYLYEGTSAPQSIINGIKLGGDTGGAISLQAQADGLEVPQSSDFDFGTGDFTCEAWIYLEGTNSTYRTMLGFDTTGGLLFQVHTMKLDFGVRGTSSDYSTSTLSADQWNHVAIVRSSGTSYWFINGTLDKTDASVHSTRDFSNATAALIGDYQKNTTNFDGSISNLRVSNVARYTSSFTPSTTPLASDANTVLLIGQNPDPFADNSSSSHSASSYGSPAKSGVGPFTATEAGEGGLVWSKIRTLSNVHYFYDTERGVNKRLSSNSTAAEQTETNALNSFNSNGFTLGSQVGINGSAADWGSAADYASWTFRKAPKFFTCLTYTGDGTSDRQISHNLGSVPAVIICKNLADNENWQVYHKDVGNDKRLLLNQTAAAGSTSTHWNNTTPTATEFTVGSHNGTNGSGDNIVAYLFAHNDGDGEFGPDGDADIIKCGSYTGGGSSDVSVDLGFEPQWLLIKTSSRANEWMLVDTMRGAAVEGDEALLTAESSNAEFTGSNNVNITPTGFDLVSSDSRFNDTGHTYIYIAIRRGTKVPESGTEVFKTVVPTANRSASPEPYWPSGFTVDMAIHRANAGSTEDTFILSRVAGENVGINTNTTDAENSLAFKANMLLDYNTGVHSTTGYGAAAGSEDILHMWGRAPGFFDAVAYSGNSTSGRTVSHNLTVAPEMMWVKKRSDTADWAVYTAPTGSGKYLELNATAIADTVNAAAYWNNTTPSSDVFTLGDTNRVNASGGTYVAYLFASLPGISKVGSYTGNGTSQTIDCGFSNSARFVLIKETSGTSPWHVFDTERGIVAGNDPRLKLDSTDAETTTQDFIDPAPSGFAVTSSSITNGSGDEYIFYAIA